MLGGVARFIVFEGGEASGKSTQSVRLARRLGAVHTREPGGTAIGARLRALLLDARTEGLEDRLEAAGAPFHDRVARGYRALASVDANRWVTIDGSGDADEVEAAVWTAVSTHLPDLTASPAADGPVGNGRRSSASAGPPARETGRREQSP